MLDSIYINNSVGEYLLALSLWIVISASAWIFHKVVKDKISLMSKKTDTLIDDVIVKALSLLEIRFFIITGLFVSVELILVTNDLIRDVIFYSFILYLSYEVIKIANGVINLVICSKSDKLKSSGRTSFASALPFFGDILKVIIFILVLLSVLSNLGVNVNAIIAGLGIGGLAFAFAFQKILADLFGAFVIFIDQPFSTGDSVSIGDISGSIEKVGFKTTKIRSFDGQLIIVPNEKLTTADVMNYDKVERRRVNFLIPVSYESSNEHLDNIGDYVKDVIGKIPKTTFARCDIGGMDEHSISYYVYYYVETPDWDEYFKIKKQVMLSVIKELKNKQIPLGYPIEVYK